MNPVAPTNSPSITSKDPKIKQVDPAKVRAQTQKWVSQTFFGTLLKQMRESPFKSELFSGGRGGAAFSSLMDQHMVDSLSKSVGGNLVNSITKRLVRNAGGSANSKIETKGNHVSTVG